MTWNLSGFIAILFLVTRSIAILLSEFNISLNLEKVSPVVSIRKIDEQSLFR